MNRVGKSATILRRSALRTEKSNIARMSSIIPTHAKTSSNKQTSPSLVNPYYRVSLSNNFFQSARNQKMSKFMENCKNIAASAGKSLSSKKLSEFTVSSVSVTFICSMGELALWAVLNLENGFVEFVIDDNNGL